MADIVLPVVGGVVGFVLGGPAGAVMGANLGAMAAGAFFPKSQSIHLPTKEGPRLADLRVQTATYGKMISKTYGTMRIAGNVIWATDIKEVRLEKTSSTSSGGGKGGGGSTTTSQTSVTYEYFVTLAIALCEGPVDEVIRVWADSKVLTEDVLSAAQGKYNVHLGDEDQGIDDIMSKYLTAGTIPAYRGMAYVVIEDFPLAEYGNRIPNFTFEVRRTVKFTPSIEDKIKDMILIPGAGEFVYGTNIATKQDGAFIGSSFTPSGDKNTINMHNYEGKADVVVAIDQMLNVLPNLEWVAVVVTWFATSTDAGACEIVPKVEFQGTTQVLPTDWNVAGIDRASAQLVLFIDPETPTYGGTPSDNTVVDICAELKSRGLSVMLYPMPFVDELTPDPKPWRGRIVPANATDANNWFTKTNGYNAFITHYANLMAGKVDAFVIGSELVGMTGYSDVAGNYPAVGQLVTLAATVKGIMGGGTQITYAADWSEYHSTGGWFNLDPLWASSNIDFVGIDSYFPLTEDLPQIQIDEQAITDGWESGEGWNYYYADSVNRTGKTNYTDAKFAWKNLEYWWKNTHTNPDTSTTAWASKMKPVWFTEFGFPSVDGCANQPNVFFDPTSSESYFPRGSKGRIDFQAQREALNATLDYLETRSQISGNANLIPRRFLWTWDARPFSFWPDLEGVWQDSILWNTGHWVQGKLGNSTLGAIVAELFQSTGLTGADYDVTRLTETVEGFTLTSPITVRNALEFLTTAFFFDIVESDGILKCVPRGNESIKSVPEDDLIPSKKKDVQDVLKVVRAQELELPQRVNVTYIDRPFNYDPVTQTSQRQTVKAVDQVTMNLPIVMGATQAKKIADVTLYSAWKERNSFQLTIPPKYARIEPTDVITVTVSGVAHEMRVQKTDMEANGVMKISAIAEDISSYDFYTVAGETSKKLTPPVLVPDTIAQFIDAPPLPTDTLNQGLLRIGVAADGANWNGAAIYRSDDGGESGGNTFNVLAGLDGAATSGTIITNLPAGSFETWEFVTQVDVILTSGSLTSVSELAVLNGANVALIGDELVQFENAVLIGESTYRLSKLLRGRQGTEWAIGTHAAGDRFVLITPALYATAIANNLIGRELFYKTVSVGNSLGNTEESSFTYRGNNLKPFAPVHVKGVRDSSGNLTISWIRRSRADGEWRDGVGIPLGEESEIYEVDILDGSNVVRIIQSTTAQATYYVSEQVEDFGSAQALTDVNIYQLSSIVGRGHPSFSTL
ncbi:MAG: glycoside hydrolase TIM-barrel-like domain-containing protein [Proteobacteria bacterium]|nr:glycoside hydrolase TIM-barrel-like domain-containing protein [Pseudomonadota bacterium]